MSTTYAPAEVPAWPAYTLVVRDGGRVAASGPLIAASEHPSRGAAVDAVAAAAARLGRPVRAEATEADGTAWHLVISPDGAVGELAGGQPRARAPRRRPQRDAGASGGAPPADRTDARPADRAGRTGRADARPAPAAEPDTLRPHAEVLARLDEFAAEGRVAEAVAHVVRLDDHVADSVGPSHPDALRVREARARLTALAGDVVGGVRLYRDVAERWYYQGAAERAEAAAGRAHELWLRITDLETALFVGLAMVRLRNQMPGERGDALAAVLDRQARLEAARNPGAHGAR